MKATSWSLLLVLFLSTPAAAEQPAPPIRLAAVAGLEHPCAEDGICNIAVCKDDPDCPKLPDKIPHGTTAIPAADVNTPCGGRVRVQASDAPLGAAAVAISRSYPNFNAAQKAKDPHFFDAHPSGMMATNHGELKGFGVTMVRGKWPKAMADSSSSLNDPTLLFFDRRPKKQDDWKIIGMGYSFAFHADNEKSPTALGFAESDWWIHEAGYHHSPVTAVSAARTTRTSRSA